MEMIYLLAGLAALLLAWLWFRGILLGPEAMRIYFRIRRTVAGNGRVFLGIDPQALSSRIARNPGAARIFAVIRTEADAMRLVSPFGGSVPDSMDPESAPFVLTRIAYLSFAYLMTRDGTYLRAVSRDLEIICGLKDWFPSNHLANAVITLAVAIGYDWIGGELAPPVRSAIAKAILSKGLRAMFLPIPGNWWRFDAYNHNQVGYGCLGTAAVILLREFPRTASRVLAISIVNMRRPLRVAYSQFGEYVEGPAYWAYGTTYTVLFIEALRSGFGDAFGLDRSGPLLASASYFFHLHGSSGAVANFSDGRIGLGPAEIMWWFANRLSDPRLADFEWRKISAYPSASALEPNHSAPILPLACVWALPSESLAGDAGKVPGTTYGGTMVTAHRTGWGADDAYCAFKGGSPSYRHGQMDCGSFIFESQGVRWGIDPGSVDYAAMRRAGIRLWSNRPKARRWDVFRLNNFSHSTLAIDARRQRPQGTVRIVRCQAGRSGQFSIMDLSTLYSPGILTVRRGVFLFNESQGLLVKDEIVSLRDRSLIRWAMATRAQVVESTGKGLVLFQDGRRLYMTVIGDCVCEWRTFEADQPPAPHDEPNPGMRLVGFEYVIEKNCESQISVSLSSMEYSSSGYPEAHLRLEEWSAGPIP